MYNNQTVNSEWSRKVYQLTVMQFPSPEGLDSENLSQGNYSVKVPLTRLLAEMQLIKNSGGKVIAVDSVVS